MPASKEAVIRKIRETFRGVTLGNGVGLLQGQAHDGGMNGLEERKLDEKHDWGRIRVDDLDRYHSSLSFFDAEGMRFHLPAYLVAGLEGGFVRLDATDIVTGLSDYRKRQMSMLSAAQREAVRAFLLFRLQDPEHQYDWPEIEKALATYWTSEEEGPKR